VKPTIKRGLALAALLLFPAMANAEDPVVNVYNWSDYVGVGVLDDFTKETGIKVVYDTYDSMEMMETKLLAGGSGYDIVVPTDRNLARLIQAGIVQKLDKSKIPNLANQWDAIAKRLDTYDPGLEHATNYMWGTTGIGYNIDKIKAIMPDAPLDSWAMIFDPNVVSKFKDCGIHLLDSADDAPQLDEDLRKLITAWRAGDLRALEKEFLKEREKSPELYDALLQVRNRQWLPKIEALLEKDRDYLVVVGALHFVGRDGLLALLRNKGHKTIAVPATSTPR
jgi:spermidine/putrescine-binding protein